MTTTFLDPVEEEKLTEFLFSRTWEKVPDVERKKLWELMTKDRLYPTLEIPGINEICHEIFEHNQKKGDISEIRCISAVQHEKTSLFYVTYGAQYGNSWFSYRTREIMENLDGSWDAHFLLVFNETRLEKIYQLPEEIYNLKVHVINDHFAYFTGHFRFFENIWILDQNGVKLGESEKYFAVKSDVHISTVKDYFRPTVLKEIKYQDQIILEIVNILWENYNYCYFQEVQDKSFLLHLYFFYNKDIDC